MSETVYRSPLFAKRIVYIGYQRRRSLHRVIEPTAVGPAVSSVVNMLSSLATMESTVESALIARSSHTLTSSAQQLILLKWATTVFWVFPLAAGIYECMNYAYSRSNRYNVFKPSRPASCLLHGVDISGSQYFSRPAVQDAVKFAERAHSGQKRKTGEDYVSHCIHTALILESLLASSLKDERCEMAIICSLLHDTLDDTATTKHDLKVVFGEKIANDVEQVSNLSSLIQLLRRQKRKQGLSSDLLSSIEENDRKSEESKLRTLILKRLEDPMVLTVKLADRLHNMRTLYALDREKQKAVAHETQQIFCTLAERLGLLSLKAEMEDLCFCILHPRDFVQVYYEREVLWKKGKPLKRRFTRRQKKQEPVRSFEEEAKDLISSSIDYSPQELISLVTPFTQVRCFGKRNDSQDDSFGLTFLQKSIKKIQYEIQMCSFSAGLDIHITGRIKSLYSTYNKKKLKKIPIDEVYDILGLKVVVKDSQDPELAQQVCYKILSLVQDLWKGVPTEMDDYIVSPKKSGYQSLHVALTSEEKVPFEVQIRTASMDDDAEHGHAAHWHYKETIESSSLAESNPLAIRDQIWGRQSTIVGHPVVRIRDGSWKDGIVLSIDKSGLIIIVAICIVKKISRSYGSYTFAVHEDYDDLKEYCKKKGWTKLEGSGDFEVAVEKYVLCTDNAYHKLDNFGHKHSTLVRPVRVFESDAKLKKHLENLTLRAKTESSAISENDLEMRDRISHLKSMMGYFDEVVPRRETRDVHILILPEARIESYPRGSTIADVLALGNGNDTISDPADKNLSFIKVNNQLVRADTTLQDADVVFIP